MNSAEYFAEVDNAYGLFREGALEQRIRELCAQCAGEYGSEHPLYAAMLSELGAFYRGQSRLEDSEQAFTQALEILGRSKGTDSADYATALNNLAGTHRRQGKSAQAVREFRECMEIYRQAGQGEAVLGASCLNNLALVYLDTEDFASAAEALRRASDILKKFPEAQDEYASSLINLASIRFRLGAYAEAEQELSEAVTLMETALGTDTPHYHAALNLLGILALNGGRRPQAAAYFRRALTAAETMYAPDHPEVLAIRQRLAQCQEDIS